MAFSSHHNRARVMVHVKSATSSSDHCKSATSSSDHCKGGKRGSGRGGGERSSGHKYDVEKSRVQHQHSDARGGSRGGRPGSHQEHRPPRRPHHHDTADVLADVELRVVLDQATTSNSHKGKSRHQHNKPSQYKEKDCFSSHGKDMAPGGSGMEQYGQLYEKFYQGHHYDCAPISGTKSKSSTPVETFKSDSPFHNPDCQRDQGGGMERGRAKHHYSGRGQDGARGRGRSRGRGHSHHSGGKHTSCETAAAPQIIVVNNYITDTRK